MSLRARISRVLRGGGEALAPRDAVRAAFLWGAINLLLAQVAGFVIFVILSHRLTPVDFGVFALALIVVDLFSLNLRFAAQDAIVQAQDFSDRRLSTAFWCLMGAALALLVVAAAGAGPLAAVFSSQGLALVLPALALSGLVMPVQAVCEGLIMNRFGYRTIAIRNIGGVAAGGVAGLAVAFSDAAEWALVAQRLAQGVFAAAFLMGHTRWRPTLQFAREDARSFSVAAFQLWTAQVSAVAAGRLCEAAIGARLGAGDLGQVRMALRFIETLNAPLTAPVSSLLVPGIARIGADTEARRRFFLDLTSLTALLCVPAFVGVALVAQDVVGLLLDPAYAPAAGALAALALIQAMAPFGFFRNGLLAGMRRNGLRLGMAVFDSLVTVAAVAVAAAFSLQAAMAAWLAASALLAAITTGLMCRVLQVAPLRYVAVAAPAYVAAAAMALAVLGVQEFAADWPLAVRFAAAALVGAGVYAGVLALGFKEWAMRALTLLRRRPGPAEDASAEGVVPAGAQPEGGNRPIEQAVQNRP